MISKLFEKKGPAIWGIGLLLFLFVWLYTDSVYAEDFEYDASDDGSVKVVLTQDSDEMYNATVIGTGKMKDYDRPNQRPWHAKRNSIKSVTVEAGVTHIGSVSFYYCQNLTEITLKEGLQTIGDRAFNSNPLSPVSIPKSVETIGVGAFYNGTNTTTEITVNGSRTKLSKITWNDPTTVASIVNAYSNSYVVNNWQSSYINDQDPDEVFYVDVPTELVIIDPFEYADPNNKTIITGYKSDAADIMIPDGVITIGEGAFADNSFLETINFNNVTTIKEDAFKGCVDLKKAVIPGTVETIEDGAFANCNNLTIYGNNNSAAFRYAEENGIDFIAMKPYLVDQDSNPVTAEIPVGDKFELDLSKYFTADYDTELSYESKSGESDYQAVEGNKYVFNAETAGVFTIIFRAVDSYNTPSDDTLSATITVINNEAPVLDDQKGEFRGIALFGEPITIDLNGAFIDPDGDPISYKMIMAGDYEDWDEAFDIEVEDGAMTYTPWQLSEVGTESEFLIKAYDKWGKASEKAFKVYIKTHSANVQVKTGVGIHSLDSLKFKFSREGAEDIVKPIEVVGNNYYFDLEYVTRTATTGQVLYVGPYEYSYEVTLDGCEPITGTRKFGRGVQLSGNTVEAEFSNPTQEEKDKQAVANVISLIENLGDITLESEDAVNAAQAAYEALYDDLKPQVTNYDVLHLSKLVLSSLKAQKAAEDAKADALAAQAEAEKAQSNADKAKEDAEKAKKAAEDAKADAEAAQRAAETAQAKAEEEQRKADEAKQAAETAKAEAEDAQAKAEAAQQKAEQVAQEASSSDGETAKQIKELQNTLEKTAAELAALKDTLAAKENKVAGLKLKSKARKITATWKKNADADGYQVQFKLKSAKKYKTLKTLTGIKAVSKKLKKGKKYQFRVATYKTVDGKKIYGKWVTKTVKCK